MITWIIQSHDIINILRVRIFLTFSYCLLVLSFLMLGAHTFQTQLGVHIYQDQVHQYSSRINLLVPFSHLFQKQLFLQICIGNDDFHSFYPMEYTNQGQGL